MAKSKDRDRQREARWRRIVREHARSGLGVRDFCRKSRLPESAFYFWRRELLRRQEQEQEHREAIVSPPKPTFVAVRVNEHTASANGGRIEIELSGGRRVHVIAPVDRQALADVLLAVSDAERAVLEARRC